MPSPVLFHHRDMEHLTDICLNIRIAAGEILGTVAFLFLIVFGAYKA
jgi:hypothetical protein